MKDRPRFALAEWCILLLSVSLYVASFFLPAMVVGTEIVSSPESRMSLDKPMIGHQAFWNAMHFSQLSWSANPCYWLAAALAFLRRVRLAALAASAGVVLALVTLFVYPAQGRIDALGVGYWIWLASIGLLSATYVHRWVTTRAGAFRERKDVISASVVS